MGLILRIAPPERRTGMVYINVGLRCTRMLTLELCMEVSWGVTQRCAVAGALGRGMPLRYCRHLVYAARTLPMILRRNKEW